MRKLSDVPLEARVNKLLVIYDGYDYVLGTVNTAWPNGLVEVEFVGYYPELGQADQFTLAEEYHTWGRPRPASHIW